MTEILTGAENRYSGIPTMRRALAEYGLPAPEFKNLRGEFVVTFYNAAASAGALEEGGPRAGAEDLLAFCRTPRTRQEIAGYLGVKTVFYAVQHYVKPLLAEGKLAMTLRTGPRARTEVLCAVKALPGGLAQCGKACGRKERFVKESGPPGSSFERNCRGPCGCVGGFWAEERAGKEGAGRWGAGFYSFRSSQMRSQRRTPPSTMGWL